MAERVKEFAYSDDSKESVDVINLLLLGWILLGLVVYILGNVIATQLRKRKAKKLLENAEPPIIAETAVKQNAELTSTAVPVAKEYNRSFTYTLVQTPVCSGNDSDVVQWLNNVFMWIYNQRIVSPVFNSWLSALNTRTRLLSTEHGILVDFQNVHCDEPVNISDVFESTRSKGIVNISCDIEVLKVLFEVVVTQVKEKDTNVFKYLLNLHRLFGQVRVDCLPEESAFSASFTECPQIELEVDPDNSVEISPEESEALRNLVCEIASEAFASSTVDLRFSSFPDCPKYEETIFSSKISREHIYEEEKGERLLVKIIKANNLTGKQDSIQPYCIVEMDDPPQHFQTYIAEDGANPFWDVSFVFMCKNLSSELLFELYDKDKPGKDNFLGLGIVSIEELLKNPSQRQIIPLQARPLENDNVTGTLTAEFLFLDYNSPTTEVTQLGPLPTTRSDESIQSNKTVQTNSRVTAGGTIITTTTIKRTNEGTTANDNTTEAIETTVKVNEMAGSHAITQSRQKFLNDLIHDDNDSNNQFLFNTDTDNYENVISDLISKLEVVNENHVNGDVDINCGDEIEVKCEDSSSVHDIVIEKVHVNNEVHENGFGHNFCMEDAELVSNILNIVDNVDICSSTSTIVEAVAEKDVEELTNTALKELEKQGKPTAPSKSTLIIHSVQRTDTSGADSLEASPASHPSADSRSSNQISMPPSPSIHRNGVDRSRPKEKKSLLGNIRKKLSFRKTRSKSMELRTGADSPAPGQNGSRSVSNERAKSSMAIRETASVKSGRRFLGIPGSTRSSFSEASGLSAASSRTYINENSTLVIEINENGIVKRYLIPTSMIHRSKWKKKGIKLHLYNDHVFVAKHLSGSSYCQVCKKHLTRRPGKQGYECRDCNLQCHKSCHVKVANFCPNSSVTSMEVEYIHDPKLSKPKSA